MQCRLVAVLWATLLACTAAPTTVAADPPRPSLDFGGEVSWSLYQYLQKDPIEESTSGGRNQVMVAPHLTARFGDHVSAFVDLELRHDFVDSGRSRFLLREAYAELFYRGFSARFGLQTIRWGRSDVTKPTDNLARRDYDELFDPQYMGVPAVRLRYARPRWSLEFDWIPTFAPALFQQTAPGRWVLPRHVASDVSVLTGDGETVALQTQFGAMAAPELTGSGDAEGGPGQLWLDPQLAGRFDLSLSPVDFGVSLFWGRSMFPSFIRYQVTNGARAVADGVVELAVTPVYERQIVPGLDAVVTAGPVNIKAEAAYFITADRDSSDCLVDDPYLRYAIGAEWFANNLIGQTNLAVRVEWAGDVEVPLQGDANIRDGCGLFDEARPLADSLTGALEVSRLTHPYRHGLFWNIDWRFNRIVAMDLRGSVTIDGDWLVRGKLDFTAWRQLHIGVGGLILGGREDTLFQTFAHNKRIELDVRYIF